MKPTLLLVLTLLLAGPAQAQDSNNGLQPLIDRAEELESRGRLDLAIQTWERLLSLQPDSELALARLAGLHEQNGAADLAAQYRRRLAELNPNSSRLQGLQAQQEAVLRQRELVSTARTAVREGDFERAAQAYYQAQDVLRPEGALAVEIYEGMAGQEAYWEQAKKALRSLAQADPGNARLQLALARVHSYRPQTRRQAIAELFDLQKQLSVAAPAKASLRQALIWLEPRAADRGLIQRYLSEIEDAPEIRAKLDLLRQQASNQRQQRIQGQADEAYALLRAGDVAAARLQFQALAEQYPDAGAPLAGLAAVAQTAGDQEQAVALYEQANRKSPSQSRNWAPGLRSARFYRDYNRAEQLRLQGNWEAALPLFEQAFAAAPSDVDPGLRLPYALSLQQQGNLSAAIEQLQLVVAQQPEQADARRMLAEVYLRQGNLAAAEELVSAAEDEQIRTRLRPAQAERLRDQAQQQFAARRYAAARSLLEEALTLDPDSPWIRLDLARNLRELGQVETASELLQSLLQTHGDEADVRKAVAYQQADAQQWPATLRILETIPVAARDPELVKLQRRAWIEYQIQRAKQAAARGNWSTADAALSAAARAVGNDQSYFPSLATGWQTLGDSARALSYLRRAMAGEAADTGVKLQYAAMLLQNGLDAEFSALVNSLRDEPLSLTQQQNLQELVVGYRLQLADRAREAGDYAAAYDALRDVIVRRPEDTNVVLALARIFAGAGDHEEALALYQRVLDEEPDHRAANLGLAQTAISAGLDTEIIREALRRLRREDATDPAYLELEAQYAQARGLDARALRFLRAAQRQQQTQETTRPPRLALQRLAPTNSAPSTADAIPLAEPLALKPGAFARPVSPQAEPSLFAQLQPLRLQSADSTTQLPAGIALKLAPQLRPRFLRSQQSLAANESAENRPLRSLPTAMRRLQAQVSPRATADLRSRLRQGEAGLSRLSDVALPLQLHSKAFEWGTVGVAVQPQVISAGELSGEARLRLGTLALIGGGEADSISVNDSGLAGSLHFAQGALSASIGVTPYGFLEDRLTGHVRWQPQWGDWQPKLGFVRLPVTDSVLSWAGQRDALLGVNWGGVSRSGMELGLVRDIGLSGVYADLRVSQLDGRNVDENASVEMSAGTYRHRDLPTWGRLTYGFNITAFGYDKNQRHFSFGHGGYFSPQMFLAAVVPVELRGRWDDVYYRMQAAFGYQTFREDGAPWFPTSAILQQELDLLRVAEPELDLAGGYAGLDDSGLAYLLRGDLSYPVADRFAVTGRFSVDNAQNFREYIFHMGLRYSFTGPVEFNNAFAQDFFR